jgi:hypothetical protein
VAFPDLDAVHEAATLRPVDATLSAWTKLAETDRRLAFFRWLVAITDPARPQYHLLLDDAESAFLLSFEATLQLLKNHFSPPQWQPGFEVWLEDLQQERDTLVFRAVRTLRHLEAHVRADLIPSTLTIHPSSPEEPRVTIRWQFAPLTAADLNSLRTPHLADAELDRWNALARTTAVDVLMAQALGELAEVVGKAERRAQAGAA